MGGRKAITNSLASYRDLYQLKSGGQKLCDKEAPRSNPNSEGPSPGGPFTSPQPPNSFEPCEAPDLEQSLMVLHLTSRDSTISHRKGLRNQTLRFGYILLSPKIEAVDIENCVMHQSRENSAAPYNPGNSEDSSCVDQFANCCSPNK